MGSELTVRIPVSTLFSCEGFEPACLSSVGQGLPQDRHTLALAAIRFNIMGLRRWAAGSSYVGRRSES